VSTRWPTTRITLRGDGTMSGRRRLTWCEDIRGPRIIAPDCQAPRIYPRMIPLCSRFDSVLFTPKMSAIACHGNYSRSPLASTTSLTTRRSSTAMREARHKAGSRDCERRAIARIEAAMHGLDTRFVVTSLEVGSTESIYDRLYCARGQIRELNRAAKTQLASDRTSCCSALANQVRLVRRTTAYWLMLMVCATQFPRSGNWPPPSSRRCTRLLKIVAAWLRPRPMSNRTLLPPARKPISSATCPAPSTPARPITGGPTAQSPVSILKRVATGSIGRRCKIRGLHSSNLCPCIGGRK